jgi:alcohol dehydrogenase
VKITDIRLDRMRFPLNPPFHAAWDPDRLADVAFALGVGDTAHSTGWNATAAIEAISALAAAAGMIHRLSDFGITPADFDQIAADALDDDVLANTPRMPTGSDIREMLAASEIA